MSTIRVPKIVFAVAMTTLIGSIAFAIPVKDQYQEGFSGANILGFFDPEYIVGAQTFTPSISGLLDSIEIHSMYFYDSGSGIKVSILATSGGIPTGTSLGSAVGLTSGFQAEEWNAIDLSAQNIFLAAGVTYALMIEPVGDTDFIYWDSDFWLPGLITDPYAGGAFFTNEDNAGWLLKNLNTDQEPWYVDAMFRTYMDSDVQGAGATVPEPMTLVLLGLAFAGMSIRKVRRSK